MPETTNPVEAIFLEAVEKSAEERRVFLEERCGGDSELLQWVTELLASHEQTGSFFVDQKLDWRVQSESTGPTAQVGQMIGPYKLLQEIGEGGMGVVFMADQVRPVRRKVAFKVIKPGMDTKAVVARFEAERQALAMMDHANIARVFDGGVTDEGRPYFVMELVKGVPITEYCDKNKLATQERLELFVDVCQAVQHAHQKGIIHRDLKPSNILVTLHDGKPVVKVIDFGVAKAINQQLTEKTLFTTFGQMVGTPQYMSPEQAEMSGLDVDTRSDVYSLGVILYEILTGSTPLESERLRSAGYAEIQRLIKEEEPPRPSNRISTSGEKLTIIAKHRSISPDRLRRLVRGDIDWIAMKALEKDRGRRYETPSLLARDVEHYLSGEAVQARPPTWGYRATKYVRRHRIALAFLTVLIASLVFGLGGILWKAAELERSLAQHSNSLLGQAMVSALGGDVKRATEAMDEIRDEDVCKGDLLLAEAILAMTAGELDDAVAIAEASVPLDSNLQGRDRVAAIALKYTVLFWQGENESADSTYLLLQSLTPETDHDKLLLAFALIGNRPERAFELLESIDSAVGRTGVGLLFRANLHSIMAGDKRDAEQWREALYGVKAATYLLPNSQLGKSWLIQIAAANAELAIQEGRESEARIILQKFTEEADALPRVASTALDRWIFYSVNGDRRKLEQACLDASPDMDCKFLIPECLAQPTAAEAVSRFNHLTKDKNLDTPWGRIARAHIYARGGGPKEEIVRIVEPVLEYRSPLLRRHALAALCSICDQQEIRDFARNARTSQSREFEQVDDLWHGEKLVKFFATGKFDRDLLEQANDHAFTLSNVCFTRGMYKLAGGDKEGAIAEFRTAVLKGGIFTLDYCLAKSYLLMLAPDQFASEVRTAAL